MQNSACLSAIQNMIYACVPDPPVHKSGVMHRCIAVKQAHVGVASFSPMMPQTIRARLNRRAGLAGSPNRMMPRIAVPTAPTPTQIA